MLTLGRRSGQTIVLKTEDGLRITVRVNKLSASVCKLSIDAPEHVKIIRGEIEGKDVQQEPT